MTEQDEDFWNQNAGSEQQVAEFMRRWSEQASDWNTKWEQLHTLTRQQIEKMAEDWDTPQHVLDLMAGSATFRILPLTMLQGAETITICDLCPDMLHQASNEAAAFKAAHPDNSTTIDCQLHDIWTSSAPLAHQADLVTCFFAMHYWGLKLPQILQMIHNSLSPEGHFILTDLIPPRGERPISGLLNHEMLVLITQIIQTRGFEASMETIPYDENGQLVIICGKKAPESPATWHSRKKRGKRR